MPKNNDKPVFDVEKSDISRKAAEKVDLEAVKALEETQITDCA